MRVEINSNQAVLNRGFSLVEMLTVIAVFTILLSIAAVSSTGVLSSIDLSSTSDRIVSTLSRAREEAITRNQNVQVRFYNRDDTYREIALGVVEAPDDPSDPDYTNPENFDFNRIRNNLVLSESLKILGEPYSTIISGATAQVGLDVQMGTETLDDVDLEYSAITFQPDGRVRLDSREIWTLTIAEVVGSETGLPQNFVTIQVDSNSGQTTVMRP